MRALEFSGLVVALFRASPALRLSRPNCVSSVGSFPAVWYHLAQDAPSYLGLARQILRGSLSASGVAGRLGRSNWVWAQAPLGQPAQGIFALAGAIRFRGEAMAGR